MPASASVVSLTDAGRALIGEVLPGHEEVVGDLLFEPLSRDDAHALADLLTPIRDHMRAAPPRSSASRRRSRRGVGHTDTGGREDR